MIQTVARPVDSHQLIYSSDSSFSPARQSTNSISISIPQASTVAMEFKVQHLEKENIEQKQINLQHQATLRVRIGERRKAEAENQQLKNENKRLTEQVNQRIEEIHQLVNSANSVADEDAAAKEAAANMAAQFAELEKNLETKIDRFKGMCVTWKEGFDKIKEEKLHLENKCNELEREKAKAAEKDPRISLEKNRRIEELEKMNEKLLAELNGDPQTNGDPEAHGEPSVKVKTENIVESVDPDPSNGLA